jgi:hypothetical protein
MKRTGVVIILLILLLLSAGTNTFLYLGKKDSEANAQLELVALRDSMQKELLRIEDSLNTVVLALQQENATLVTKVTELEGPNNPRVIAAYKEVNRLRRQLIQMSPDGGININGGDANLSGLKKQLADAKVKIKDLTAQLDTLIIERNQAVADKEVAVNEKEALGMENRELKERLEKGAIPQFGTLITSAYDDKKKLVDKAKKVNQFIITYDILENPMISQVVEEEVTIRLIDPDGGVLSLNNKTLKDKSLVFSLKENISFDGALQKVKWKFPEKGTLTGKLKKGKYTTELWTRGLLRQKNTFTLN